MEELPIITGAIDNQYIGIGSDCQLPTPSQVDTRIHVLMFDQHDSEPIVQDILHPSSSSRSGDPGQQKFHLKGDTDIFTLSQYVNNKMCSFGKLFIPGSPRSEDD